MNTPESREGNLIRYIVYLISYLMVVGVVKIVTVELPIRIWDLVLFVLISVMALLFNVYRFNREQRFFSRSVNGSLLDDFGLTIGLTIVVTIMRVFVSWLQISNKVSLYSFQTNYLKHESVTMYWFVLVAVGIVIPILQQFLASGFLFNYAFRKNSKFVAICGIIFSGVVYSLLNWQSKPSLLLIDFVFGALFAWSYLYSQTLWLPIYLAVLNGLLLIVTI